PDFVIDINRGGIFHISIPAGLESFTDYGLLSGVPYQYSLVTRLTANDFTSIPANISVIPMGSDCVVGDVNGDQRINFDDVQKLLLFILEYEEPTIEDMCRADMDYDNELTVNDVLRLVDIVLGGP
ncbi:MAG: hypothetical protein IIB95_13505, partial [Candidatus Marinimicrobia bacterium]|nr:hypothetical protein [Candidatus Neomarinimicrobiota bacterium]